MSNRKIRIVLADDHSLLRMGLVSLLGYQRDLEVVGQAEDGHQAVDLVERLHPDLVVMDLMMPVLSGADATAKIRAAHPETKVLVLTSFGTSADLVRAVRNGATGALLKDAPNEELLAAIREVAAGHTAYSRDVRQQLRAAEDQPDLTDRQRAILAAAARGLTTDNIATELRISVDGVKKHFSAIFQKLGASSRSEAVAIALRHNLLEKE